MHKSSKEFFSSFIDILYEAIGSAPIFGSSLVVSIRPLLCARSRELFDADLDVYLGSALASVLLIGMKALVKVG